MTRNWPLFPLADCLANQTCSQAIHQTKNASDHSTLGCAVPYGGGSPTASKAQQPAQNEDRSTRLTLVPCFLSHAKGQRGGGRGGGGSTGPPYFYFFLYQQIYSGSIFSRSDHGHTRTYTDQKFHICILKIPIPFFS